MLLNLKGLQQRHGTNRLQHPFLIAQGAYGCFNAQPPLILLGQPGVGHEFGRGVAPAQRRGKPGRHS